MPMSACVACQDFYALRSRRCKGMASASPHAALLPTRSRYGRSLKTAMRCLSGESMIEVLLSLSIAAILSVTLAQTHLAQRQASRIVSQRLQAAAILEVLAEHRLWRLRAVPVEVQRNGPHEDGTSIALAPLPEGRIEVRTLTGSGAIELVVSWRDTRRQAVMAMNGAYSPAGFWSSLSSTDRRGGVNGQQTLAPRCMTTMPGRLCEALLVPATEPTSGDGRKRVKAA